MAAVAGDDDKGHFFGDVPDLDHSLLVHHDAVVDVVPQPGEDLVPDLDQHFVVVGGDFPKVAPGVPDQSRVARLAAGCPVLHEPDEVFVPKDHSHQLIPGFQDGPHHRRSFLVDAVNQLPPQPLDHLRGIEAPVLLRERRQVDRFRGNHDGLLGITEEGHDPLQGVGVVRLAEKDIDQIFLLFVPPAPVSHEHRDDQDRHVQLLLGVQQLRDGVIGMLVLDEFRTAQVDNDALFLQDNLFQVAGFVRVQDGSFQNETGQEGEDDLEGLVEGLPEEHVHAVGIGGFRYSLSVRQFPQDQAVELAFLFEGINDNPGFREPFERFGIVFRELNLGQGFVNQPLQGEIVLLVDGFRVVLPLVLQP